MLDMVPDLPAPLQCMELLRFTISKMSQGNCEWRLHIGLTSVLFKTAGLTYKACPVCKLRSSALHTTQQQTSC